MLAIRLPFYPTLVLAAVPRRAASLGRRFVDYRASRRPAQAGRPASSRTPTATRSRRRRRRPPINRRRPIRRANRPAGRRAKGATLDDGAGRAGQCRRRVAGRAVSGHRATRRIDRNQSADAADQSLGRRQCRRRRRPEMVPATGMTLSSGRWFNRGCWYAKEDVIYLGAVGARPAQANSGDRIRSDHRHHQPIHPLPAQQWKSAGPPVQQTIESLSHR